VRAADKPVGCGDARRKSTIAHANAGSTIIVAERVLAGAEFEST
jgi:hypothetical protein